LNKKISSNNDVDTRLLQNLTINNKSNKKVTLLSRDTLSSKDDKVFQLSKKACEVSVLLDTMIKNEEEDDDADESYSMEIPLPNVDSRILEKVIEFCNHYETNPLLEKIEAPVKCFNMEEIVPKWYAEYSDIHLELLFEIASAANYMEIPPLLNLCCATIATRVKGKTENELKKLFADVGTNKDIDLQNENTDTKVTVDLQNENTQTQSQIQIRLDELCLCFYCKTQLSFYLKEVLKVYFF
jgi:S-phase kinase-associated protein 1